MTGKTVPRRMRRPSRRVRLALAGIVAALAVAVPLAWANHQFGDVPNANVHHDDISGIAGAGITTGCNPPANTLYCPDLAVRRDQMASFLRRGLGRTGYAEFDATVPGDYGSPVGVVSVTPGMPPGALPGAANFVVANAQGTLYVPDATGCPCEYIADLWQQDVEWLTGQPLLISVTQAGFYPFSLTGAARFTAGGSKDILVLVARFTGTADSFTWGNATAQFVPFGSTGGNTFGAPAPSAGTERVSPVPARPDPPQAP
jgi:hypothetical protein